MCFGEIINFTAFSECVNFEAIWATFPKPVGDPRCTTDTTSATASGLTTSELKRVSEALPDGSEHGVRHVLPLPNSHQDGVDLLIGYLALERPSPAVPVVNVAFVKASYSSDLVLPH